MLYNKLMGLRLFPVIFGILLFFAFPLSIVTANPYIEYWDSGWESRWDQNENCWVSLSANGIPAIKGNCQSGQLVTAQSYSPTSPITIETTLRARPATSNRYTALAGIVSRYKPDCDYALLGVSNTVIPGIDTLVGDINCRITIFGFLGGPWQKNKVKLVYNPTLATLDIWLNNIHINQRSLALTDNPKLWAYCAGKDGSYSECEFGPYTIDATPAL